MDVAVNVNVNVNGDGDGDGDGDEDEDEDEDGARNSSLRPGDLGVDLPLPCNPP